MRIAHTFEYLALRQIILLALAGPSESNRSPQKTEPVSPQEVDQNWYGPMNAAVLVKLLQCIIGHPANRHLFHADDDELHLFQH